MAMEEIIVRLGVDSSGFVRVLDQANEKIGQAGTFVDGLGAKLATLVSVAALTNLAKQAVGYASDMQDAADATRTGVEEYQVLAQSARDSGASLQQLDQALIKSATSGEKAAQGNKEMAEAFAVLNINVDKFNALPTEKKLEALGAAYNSAGASQEAYAALTDILGTRSAPRLITALQQLGSEGFDAVRQKAEEAGVVLNKLDAQRLDNLSDQMQTWKVRGLVIFGEMIMGFQKIIALIDGFAQAKSFTQIVNEDFDPERIKVRMDAIAQLVAEGAIKVQAALRGPEGELVAGEMLVPLKEGTNALALVEQKINDILTERKQKEADNLQFKKEQAAAAERQAGIDASMLATANAVKMIEEGRALIRLKEMTDKERLVALEDQHAQALEVFNNMLALGEGTDKEKEAIAKRVLEIEKQISDTKAKIDADTLKAAEERNKKQDDLLKLIEKEAALQVDISQEMFNRYGRTTDEIAAGGGGSTLAFQASEEQRLAETAARQFDELARARARAAGGDQDAAREVERLQNQVNETEARRQDLADKVTSAQGGKTGDPVVDKLEETRKEIEKLREELNSA